MKQNSRSLAIIIIILRVTKSFSPSILPELIEVISPIFPWALPKTRPVRLFLQCVSPRTCKSYFSKKKCLLQYFDFWHWSVTVHIHVKFYGCSVAYQIVTEWCICLFRIAVYDLGGGTFDISILEIQKGVFEVWLVLRQLQGDFGGLYCWPVILLCKIRELCMHKLFDIFNHCLLN